MHNTLTHLKAPLMLLVCCSAVTAALGNVLPITYFSRIKTAQPWSNPTAPRVYHLGQIIQVDNDLSFSLPIPPSLGYLCVLVTADLLPPTSNTLDHYKLKPNASYKHYLITRNPAYDEGAPAVCAKAGIQPWLIREVPINPEAIDPTTLVVMLPHHFVKSVTCEEIPAVQNPFQLPILVLDDSISEQTFNDASIVLRLACLNIDPLHRKQTFVTKVTNTLRLTYTT